MITVSTGDPDAVIDAIPELIYPVFNSSVPIPVSPEIELAIEIANVLIVTPTPSAEFGLKSTLKFDPSKYGI